ncbi:MAG: hypothetical protein MR362_05585 [Hallerella sp.]|uniref:hypothetical protein n=1 Tax=Hallerella sp. TaxID=2815812 RepID=UPI002587D565|nr:hypothetical protein [Hallerella sp.]MCI5600758.1 hypothetical protein [Hallerella sp.]
MKFLTRKNLISAAAIFAAFCFTACDDSSSSEPNFPDAPSSSSAAEKIFANEVRYQASTKNMENLEKLGEVQIRYVDENGKIVQEKFDGEWKKTVALNSDADSILYAAQVRVLLKDSAEIAAIDEDLNIHVDLYAVLPYTKNGKEILDTLQNTLLTNELRFHSSPKYTFSTVEKQREIFEGFNVNSLAYSEKYSCDDGICKAKRISELFWIVNEEALDED